MIQWLADNWIILALASLYVVERSTGIGKVWKDRVRKLANALRILDTTKNQVPGDSKPTDLVRATLNHDIEIDKVLDIIKPETTPRVSKGAKILDGIMKALPLVSRFVR